MDPGTVSLLVLLMLIGLLATGMVIFVAIICVCLLSLTLFMGLDFDRLGALFAQIMIRASSSWELSAIPLFIWMGEIMTRSSLIDNMFKGLAPFVRRLPGGLLHTNVIGCALFSAVSGSSAATTATVGKITLPQMLDRGYNESLALGSLAGAGTLGLLIPPSILMIIYGLLAEVSIVRLFAAGILPGIMIALLYSIYIAIRSRKSTDPQLPALTDEDRSITRALIRLIPIMSLIIVVLGSIYSGAATPSEAAAIGVASALILTTLKGELSLNLLLESLKAAVPTACMICTILAAAAFLSTTMGFLHIPQDVATMIGQMDLSPLQLILAFCVFYAMLGLILDGISITVMTLPIALPLVIAAGIDPIWFGVFLVIMVELGQITPPVGFNLFILQGISGISVMRVAAAAFPFFLLMCLAAALIIFAPNIVLWLPSIIFD